MKKGHEILPEETYRLRDEDKFKAEAKFGSKGPSNDSNSATSST